MSVTVAVCTLDRPRLLRGALESLARMDRPGSLDWEVLVVDNGGAPGTVAVVEALKPRLPIRRVREDRLGLSHARNRALGESRAAWVAWIDDDVRVDSGWLAAYADAFEAWPDAAFFGGPIRPAFEGEPPAWLEEAFDALPAVRAAYGERDVAADSVEIRRREDLPYGGNFAVRNDVLPRRPFDPRLGRRGEDPVARLDL
ncbi:MAG: glycosyltransferase, partial [Gemmatimonadota bacterium]